MVEPREQCDMQHHAAMSGVCVCVGGGGSSLPLPAMECGTRHVVHLSSLPLPKNVGPDMY
jgi:hypothetical protein